jgi:hypothetical protein
VRPGSGVGVVGEFAVEQAVLADAQATPGVSSHWLDVEVRGICPSAWNACCTRLRVWRSRFFRSRIARGASLMLLRGSVIYDDPASCA